MIGPCGLARNRGGGTQQPSVGRRRKAGWLGPETVLSVLTRGLTTLPPFIPHPKRRCINNTFGISGVQEHANFFKNVEDASKLRLRVSECFERAALPQTTPEVRWAGEGSLARGRGG